MGEMPVSTPAPGSQFTLPARVKRTGRRQLCISLGDETAQRLERYRQSWGLRSWAQVVRRLLEDSEQLETELEEQWRNTPATAE